jgi:hypothetical protein
MVTPVQYGCSMNATVLGCLRTPKALADVRRRPRTSPAQDWSVAATPAQGSKVLLCRCHRLYLCQKGARMSPLSWGLHLGPLREIRDFFTPNLLGCRLNGALGSDWVRFLCALIPLNVPDDAGIFLFGGCVRGPATPQPPQRLRHDCKTNNIARHSTQGSHCRKSAVPRHYAKLSHNLR